MKICMNDILYSFSYALDCVEHDLLGVTTYHGPRVAAISAAMGKQLGFPEDELLDLAGCALLHDNALTEYIHEERERGVDLLNTSAAIGLAPHCLTGERNIAPFPFKTQVNGILLYHHENADGTGPFQKKASETPIKAQLVHMADQMDTHWDFNLFSEEKYSSVLQFLKEERNKMFSDECTALFQKSCSPKFLSQLQQENVLNVLRQSLPTLYTDYSQAEVVGFCTVIAKIIDYKSPFTRKHSLGIAQKAKAMGEYYGLGQETQTKLYFAGALHDVGKLAVNRDILEKPAKLSDEEYKHMQTHAYKTYEILRPIDGLGEIVDWAALHHEKLDGSGYPFGKAGDELGKMERLMACLDIYQALTEKRPYKEGMGHQQALGLLLTMAKKGQIDSDIIRDIDCAYTNGMFTD